MSDEKDSSNSNEPLVEAPVETIENRPEEISLPVQVKRGGSLTSGLALVLSLAACAGVAYLWWSGQQQDAEQVEPIDYSAQIRSQIDTASGVLRQELNDSIAALEQRSTESSRSIQQRLLADSSSQADRLSRLQADLRNDRAGLERRLEMTESSLAKLAEMRLDSARSLALAEAEYLLRLANERLQLFQDPVGALKALKLAAAQLRALDDAVFNSVRQALAAEIQSLESVRTADRVAISGQLLALARSAAEWPLDRRRSLQATGHNELEPEPGEEGWWSRLKQALSSAVTVHREQQTATVLLTLEEERLLRENLRLQLQVAQLAAVRAEQDLYTDSLTLVTEWLREYYDREMTEVGEALLTLEQLGQIDLDPELPEITTALRLLRNLQTAQELDIESGAQAQSAPEETQP
jgi:uroporphyrin-3 C-methyltransferase